MNMKEDKRRRRRRRRTGGTDGEKPRGKWTNIDSTVAVQTVDKFCYRKSSPSILPALTCTQLL